MPVRTRCATLLAVAGAAAAVAGAPTAWASGADAVVADLESQGYSVQINWLNGFDVAPLARCTVVNVNNPDNSGEPMQLGDTVYVDVRCPNHYGDDVQGSFGIGIGLG